MNITKEIVLNHYYYENLKNPQAIRYKNFKNAYVVQGDIYPSSNLFPIFRYPITLYDRGSITVRLYTSTPLFKEITNSYVTLTIEPHRFTSSTKRRINSFLEDYLIQGRVFQKKQDWFLYCQGEDFGFDPRGFLTFSLLHEDNPENRVHVWDVLVEAIPSHLKKLSNSKGGK